MAETSLCALLGGSFLVVSVFLFFQTTTHISWINLIDILVRVSPLELVEGMGLYVPFFLGASWDWDPTVWYFLLALPLTNYPLFLLCNCTSSRQKPYKRPNLRFNHSVPSSWHAHYGRGGFHRDFKHVGSEFQRNSLGRKRGGDQSHHTSSKLVFSQLQWPAFSGQPHTDSWG